MRPAGNAGAPQQITWKEEHYDQGGIVRNSVRWDHEITADQDLYEVLGEAYRKAFSEPRGPVYLTLPREVLAENPGAFSFSSPSRMQTASDPAPDDMTFEAPPDRLDLGELGHRSNVLRPERRAIRMRLRRLPARPPSWSVPRRVRSSAWRRSPSR